jgi:hypothetical protein
MQSLAAHPQGSGFSAVGLSVVLGFITPMAGIILPAVMSVRSSARTTRFQADVRQSARLVTNLRPGQRRLTGSGLVGFNNLLTIAP